MILMSNWEVWALVLFLSRSSKIFSTTTSWWLVVFVSCSRSQRIVVTDVMLCVASGQYPLLRPRLGWLHGSHGVARAVRTLATADTECCLRSGPVSCRHDGITITSVSWEWEWPGMMSWQPGTQDDGRGQTRGTGAAHPPHVRDRGPSVQVTLDSTH